MNSRSRIFIALAAALAVASCSTTSTLRDGEYLLRSNKIRVNDKSYNAGDLSAYLLQKPNSWMLFATLATAVSLRRGLFSYGWISESFL